MHTTVRWRLFWVKLKTFKMFLVRFVLLSFAFCGGLAASSDPRVDYLLHCAGCHLPDGSSMPPEVPSLRNGLGEIVGMAEGREYLARVPGASQAPIDDQKLATLLNWILSEFNADTLPAEFEPLTAQEVGIARAKLLPDPVKYRNRLWGSASIQYEN